MERRNIHSSEQDLGLAAEAEHKEGIEYIYSGQVRHIDSPVEKVQFSSSEKLGKMEVEAGLKKAFLAKTHWIGTKDLRVQSINPMEKKTHTAANAKSDEVEQLNLF